MKEIVTVQIWSTAAGDRFAVPAPAYAELICAQYENNLLTLTFVAKAYEISKTVRTFTMHRHGAIFSDREVYRLSLENKAGETRHLFEVV